MQFLQASAPFSDRLDNDAELEALAGTGTRETLVDLVYESVQFFGDKWFGSKEAQEVVKARLGREVPLPVISTYLSRMSQSGKLYSRGSRIHREYRLA